MLQKSELVGELNLGSLPTRWRKLDFVIGHTNAVVARRDARVIDGRGVDESRIGGHRLYPIVERYLASAEDCHMALPRLLQSHGATQTAMWAILRAQFEAAFFALWLLEPDESRIRVLRGIRVEWLDDKQSRAYFDEVLRDQIVPLAEVERIAELERHAKLSEDHTRTYKRECAALGFSYHRPEPVNVVDELATLQADRFPEQRPLLRHVWRTLAGLQHGDVGSLLRVSAKEDTVETGTGYSAQLSPSDSAFQTIAETTALLTMNAFSTYMQRHQPTTTSAVLDLAEVRRLHALWDRL